MTHSPEEPQGLRTLYGLTLDPFQRQAIAAIDQDRSVIVSAPTGAGKTLIAEYAVEKAVQAGQKLIYTAPIKALSNQKFRDFSARYGDKVGIVTGDVSIHAEAPMLIMTTEIFRNEIFDAPERVEDVRWVVFDEVHYMDDDERGTVWEESIIFAPSQIRFVCLSATVPNLEELADWISEVRSEPVDTVVESTRPVPLRHRIHVDEVGFVPFKKLGEVARRHRKRRGGRSREEQNEKGLADLLDHICEEGRLPLLYFAFQRKTCETLARKQRGRGLLSPEDEQTILRDFDELCERFEVPASSPLARRLRPLVASGVAYHHAGLLPTFKEIVERLFTTGRLRMLFTTETFALGINMPAASVVFDALERFDGVTFSPLTTRQYFQMAGRSGRRGMDEEGFVYGRCEPRFVKPGAIHTTVFGAVEPVISRFNLGYATILNLVDRLGEGLYEVGEKSLAAFQRRRRGGQKGRRRSRRLRGGRSPAFTKLIRRRIRVLGELGSLEKWTVLPKGRFAARSPGKELQLTELLFRGILEDLPPEYINVALAALLFEPRRKDSFEELNTPELRILRAEVERAVAAIRRAERRAGISNPVAPPDFSLARATYVFSLGGNFEELRDLCSTDAGDLVRTYRMVIQLLRQLRGSPAVSPDLDARVRTAITMLNRDEIDAERQLRRGSDEGDEEREEG